MTFSLFVKSVSERLSELYGPEECRAIALRLLDDFLGVSGSDYALKLNDVIPYESEELLNSAVEQMVKGRPLQYVTGFEWFCGYKFVVGEGVLIPRPETEELVEWIKECAGDGVKGEQGVSVNNRLKIFDAACGSGAIGISLAKAFNGSTVFACDLSERAMELSKINAESILESYDSLREAGVGYKLFKCDLLNEGEVEGYLPEKELDIVVSNPPYVCESEKRFIRPNVLFYEPFEALFVEDSDPLIFYRRIANIAAYSLKPGGALFFEINERFAAEVVKLLTDMGFVSAESRIDFRGKERMVRVLKK